MPQYRIVFADALFAWVQIEAPSAAEAEWAVYASYARHCLGMCPEDLSTLDFGEVLRIDEVCPVADGMPQTEDDMARHPIPLPPGLADPPALP